MADNQRIDDLRRRVHKDPASIAFAQLAEELRRNGDYTESVDVCRTGLAIHPGYLSARVTLGRALLELNHLEDAQVELELVLKSAPENLAALRALAETRHQQGSDVDALTSYRSALLLAKNDPDLQQTIDELSRKVEPQQAAAPAPASAPAVQFSYAQPDADSTALDVAADTLVRPYDELRDTALDVGADPRVGPGVEVRPGEDLPLNVFAPDDVAAVADPPVADIWASLAAPAQMAETPAEDIAAREQAVRTIAALEQWLEAIHVARAQRCA